MGADNLLPINLYTPTAPCEVCKGFHTNNISCLMDGTQCSSREENFVLPTFFIVAVFDVFSGTQRLAKEAEKYQASHQWRDEFGCYTLSMVLSGIEYPLGLEPVPMPNHSLGEKPVPTIQPKPPPAQLHGFSLGPVTGCESEEISACASVAPHEVVEEDLRNL
ncbi:hypothetical protein TURU_107469 [Turdus rufiventris]|nr:hypothetical protein TURU_107469 [Turdus rufiventris]